MIHLQLLGGLTIDGRDLDPASVKRRHPLALLALVAAAAPRPVARDKLTVYLWPESDTARASNNLRQTLFQIRRAMGSDIFLPETTAGLQLDPGRVRVDLWSFRFALARQELEEAVRVYQGPFLDSFAIPGAGELALWVEGERERLARQYLAALDTLAARAGGAGRYDEEVTWRRRQAAADPFSSLVALALLRSLVAAGDRPGAIEHASVYQKLLRVHLDMEPDPAVSEFVASLLREPRAAAAAREAGEPAPAESAGREPSSGTLEPAPAPPPTPTSPEEEAPGPTRRTRRGFRSRRHWPVALAAVALAVAFGRSMPARVAPGGATPLEEECARNVAEAGDYTLVFTLSIPEDANYDAELPPYSIDRSETLESFDRVAYCLQLDDDWVWVSMDAFTDVPAQIGVPVAATGATFQQDVTNMNVFSNTAGVVTGTGITTGRIEFWHHCYDEINSEGLPGASSTLNDFDDLYPHPRYDYDSCYGSMQVHDQGAAQTVFAYNQWDRDPEFNTGPDDLGIGNSPVGVHPDWTFEANAASYSVRTLHILARPARARPR